jgi:hypothetical protein
MKCVGFGFDQKYVNVNQLGQDFFIQTVAGHNASPFNNLSNLFTYIFCQMCDYRVRERQLLRNFFKRSRV